MSEDAALEALNAVEYLYLQRLSEPSDNSLRLVVQEAVVNRSGAVPPALPGLPELAEILKDARRIESIKGCKSFELYWKHYAAYLVTEEMVGSCGGYDDEVFSGKLLRVYSKSHFLDHLARDTGAHIQPILHYKLICLNHLIDIAAYSPPKIRVIAATPESLRTQ
jgi:hypothetical protein